MTRPPTLRRRRFIGISAAACGLPLLPLASRAETPAPLLRVWHGAALGADATIQLHHPDPAAADRLIARALLEVRRLEGVMNLYDPASSLCCLNRDGVLDDPPLDLVRVLGDAARFHALTGGEFDVTVQPLWELYAGHFGRPGADPNGPPPAAIAAAVQRVGQDALEVSPTRIRFARPGMAVTLNGIGQGYATDRVVDLLRAGGVAHALVDMGEQHALGGHPAGGPWRVGIENPDAPGQVEELVPLADQAMSTSGGYGTQFDPAGRFNHIFEPADGSTSWRYRAVSVIAPTATETDALSTAFTLMPLERVRALVRARGLIAHVALQGGRRLIFES
jgi:thiamine biosynthesis lipoprotein